MITNDNAGWTLGLFMFVVFMYIGYMMPHARPALVGGVVGAAMFPLGLENLGILIAFVGIAWTIYLTAKMFVEDDEKT